MNALTAKTLLLEIHNLSCELRRHDCFATKEFVQRSGFTNLGK